MGSGFVRGIGCVAIFESEEIEVRKRTDPSPSPTLEAAEAPSSSSSSSIGKDSDEEGLRDGGEEEVQSLYKGPLQGMEALEESLPISRGISNFYNGKSKSFTSLSDAANSCVSAKGLSKEDNAYTRKRRNLLALKTMLERPHSMLKKSSASCMIKKPATPTRSSLAIAAAMCSSPRHGNGGEDTHDHQHNFLPPLPRPGKSANTIASTIGIGSLSSSPQQFSFPLRSFSLSDLSQMASFGSSIESSDMEESF